MWVICKNSRESRGLSRGADHASYAKRYQRKVPPMSEHDSRKPRLELKIKRLRSRLAVSVKTGSIAASKSQCARTDPTGTKTVPPGEAPFATELECGWECF